MNGKNFRLVSGFFLYGIGLRFFKRPGKLFWFLGSDEEWSSGLKMNLHSLIARNVVRLSIASVADAPAAVVQDGSVGCGLDIFYLIKRKGLLVEMKRKEPDGQSITVHAGS